jgi:phosphopantothenoylcysteine synthetase/decarboxylase
VRPPLTLVVCGAPLARRTPEFVAALAENWSVSVVVSEAGRQWCTVETTVERSRPQRVVACPLTFNTANKAAAGIMDAPAAGVLCDALGAGVPVVGVPMVNDRLWSHPAWPTTLRTLDGAGVRMIDLLSGRQGAPRPVPSGTGADAVAAFDPRWVVDALG